MTSFPDADLPLKFEVRFDGTTYVDLSSRLIQGQSVSNSRGRPAGAGRASAASFGITLDNDDGALTPRNPASSYWPNVRLDIAGRARLRWFLDTFTRSQTDTWGSDWTNTGTASEYDVNGTAGTHTHPTTSVLHFSSTTPAVPTADTAATVSWSATAATASLTARAIVGEDSSNYYEAIASFATTGDVTLQLAKRIGGAGSLIGSPVTVGTYTPNAHWSVRIQQPVDDILRAKAWAGDLDIEPDEWTIDTTDPDTDTIDYAINAISSRREGANSNVSPVLSVHEFRVDCDRAWGYTDSWQPDFTTDTEGNVHSTVRITLSGSTRRTYQDDQPVRSPLNASMSGVSPGDFIPDVYVPMEGGENATSFASGLPDGPAVPILTWVTPAADSALTGSQPVATLAAGAVQRIPFPLFTDTGRWHVVLFMKIPSAPAALTTYASVKVTGGAAARVDFAISPGAPTVWQSRVYDAADTLLESTSLLTPSSELTTPGDAYGNWFTVVLGLRDGGGGNFKDWGHIGFPFHPGGGGGGTNTGAPGRPTELLIYGADAGTSACHAALFTSASFDPLTDSNTNLDAIVGWVEEQAHERAERFGREQSLPMLIVGDTSAAMGAQPVGTVEEVLGECEEADQGVLGEHELGLSFVTVASRYNQPVTLTIDLADYRLRKGDESSVLSPTYDDQNTLTESSVERTGGITAIVSAAEPRSNLRYNEGFSANLAEDDQAIQLAAFRANRGSVDQMRFAGTPLDLAANPSLIAAWQRATAISGLGRIVRTGLPAAHAPYDIDELVDGWSETLEPRRWKAVYNGQPAAPYQVGQYTDSRSRYGAAGTTTAEALDTTETGVDITLIAGHPGWVTTASHPACYSPAMLIEIGGERMAASACVSTGAGTYTLAVTRSVNGVVKSHATGAEVFIVDTGIYAY